MKTIGQSLLLASALVVPPVGAQVIDPSGDLAVRTFTTAVERYADLRDRLAEPVRPQRPSRDSWSALITRRYLASAVRAARRDARAGCIFTTAVGALIRERLARALTSAERQLLAGPGGDESAAPLPLVNEPLPAEWLVLVPLHAADELPPLPHGIEYRLTGTTLLLWDPEAEIVIDFLPDAVN